MLSTVHIVPTAYLTSAPIVETHHVYDYIENVTVCNIKFHPPQQLWNGGIGGGGAKGPQAPMQSIFLDTRNMMLSTFLAQRSAIQKQLEHYRACHVHLEPNCHVRTHARTTCTKRECTCGGRRPCMCRYQPKNRSVWPTSHCCAG